MTDITDWNDKTTEHPFAIEMKRNPYDFAKAMLELRPDELAQLFELMEKLIKNRGR